MKSPLTFAGRLRATPATERQATLQRPFRLWMTGSFAVVMAALVPLRDAGAEERFGAMRKLGHSRFDATETMLRIEAAARDQGLDVLARVNGTDLVIVLASSVGGTPVVMEEADSQPAVPLSLIVRAGSDGGADVLMAAARQGGGEGWPDSVVDDLASLPQLVEHALR